MTQFRTNKITKKAYPIKQPTKEQMRIKLERERRGEDIDISDIENISIRKRNREKPYYIGQKTGEVYDVVVPFKDGGFQVLTFDKKDEANNYIKKLKGNK